MALQVLAAVVASPGATWQPTHVGAAGQPIETWLLCAAGAGGIEIGRGITGTPIVAVPGAAVGAAISPVAIPRAGGAVATAAAIALPARGTDAGATRRAGTAGTADKPRPAGMLRAGGAATPLGCAVTRGGQMFAAKEQGGESTGPAQALQRAAPRVSRRQGTRPGIEPSRIHHRLSFRVTPVQFQAPMPRHDTPWVKSRTQC